MLGNNFNLNEGIMILLDAISIFHFPKNHLEFIQGPFDPTLKVYIDGQLWIGIERFTTATFTTLYRVQIVNIVKYFMEQPTVPNVLTGYFGSVH